MQLLILFLLCLFFLGSIIAVIFVIYLLQSRQKFIQQVHTLTNELVKHKATESFLQTRTKELERARTAMTSMTNDVLAERDRLERERAKDEAIITSVGEGMFAVSLAGNLVLLNPVAQELLQIKEEQALGKYIYQIFPLYDENGHPVAAEQRPILRTLMTAQKVSKTFVYVRNDGRKLSLTITSTPIKQNNQVIGAIGIIRDITKEKEIDRMKTEFISLASHQLRTPLSAIKWFIEMLIAGDAGPLNAEQADFAKNINDSSQRMIELVNALLNISRIESGRIIIDPKPTDLKQLVESIATELQVKFHQKRQTFILSVHERLPTIMLDPKLIRQVYLNLLTNAIKYSPEGSEITVFISRRGEEILSQVTDSGYGIPKDDQGKIFQKFFRAKNVARIETDGTGLGLYLIKTIVESSHGNIWFKSEEGHGTTFFFTLPLSGMKPKSGEVSLD